MVADGENGYKINVQNLTKIAEKIKNIFSNEELYLSLSDKALKQAQKYSTAQMGAGILHCIKDEKSL